MNNWSLDAARRVLVRLAAAILLIAGAGLVTAESALAQAWPNKPVRLVLPFPAGVPPDIVARLMADKLAALWGQGVVVDNRGGAGGIAAMSGFVRMPADGYTLAFVAASTVTLTPHLFKDPQFNVDRDLAIAAVAATGPMLITVNPAVPAQNLPELFKHVKSQPGKVNFAATLLNSVPHLTGLMLNRAAGMEMYPVPYNGSVPAITATLAGEAQVVIDGLPTLVQHVRAGKLRALAVTSDKRLPGFETIPAVSETIPGFESQGWFAMFAPAGTPAAVIEKINADVNRVAQMPDIASRLADLGMYPRPGPVATATEFLRTERALWQKVVKDFNIPAQ
jgi:tripartite-type tricarboxylate transporter receptor subunit TctC